MEVNMSRARWSAIAVAAAAGAATAGLPGRAEALIQCQATAAAGLGLTQGAAEDSWRAWVTSHFGATWSNFDIAKNKYYSETNLGVTIMQQVSAHPCRQLIIKPTTTLKVIKKDALTP
jgi:hypothetical protein